MSAAAHAARPSSNALWAARIGAVVVSGAVGLLFWELYIRFGAPVVSGPFPLQGPVGLAQTVLNKTIGLNALLGAGAARDVAEALHYLTAFIAYPLGYLLIARPIAGGVDRVVPIAPFWLVGLAYGAALFLFAGYAMGHLIAGFPPFFGLNLERIALNPALSGGAGEALPLIVGGAVPLGSLVGHMLLGLGIAIAARAVLGRAG